MNLLTIRDIAKIDHLYITKIYYFLEKKFSRWQNILYTFVAFNIYLYFYIL